MTRKTKICVLVKGLVQGVWFRAFTKEKADELGLKGWVRNVQGDQVEAVFEGDEDKIEAMIALLKKGPPLARVESVDVKEEDYCGEFESFELR